MSNPLADLAQRETKILEHVCSFNAEFGERFRILEQDGTFKLYVTIHAEYVDLIDSPEHGLEALKRALFIQWYSLTEPGCFTGIFNLEDYPAAMVFRKIDRMLREGPLEAELDWMLQYYYDFGSWTFPKQLTPDSLYEQLDARAPFKRPSPLPDASAFDGRGQMAEYWRSILENWNSRAFDVEE